MNFRTEDEKTQDILMYEIKSKASGICEKYKKIKKKADLVMFLGAVVFGIAAFPVFYRFYDTENIVGMISTIIAAALLTVASRLVCGAVLSRSLSTFVKWGSLSAKWWEARKDMHDIEEKFAEQTAFDDDIKKTEKRLVDLSETLIEFAKKNNIEY